MIAKARTVTRRWHGSYEPDQTTWEGRERVLAPQGIDHTLSDSRAVKYHDHLKVCSCLNHGCGNPRRGGWYPPTTRAEQAVELELREELEELHSVE